jgi:hypothetical protein
LQEDLLTLLCLSKEDGKAVYHMVTPAHFEGEYKYIATLASDFWKKHNTCPGEAHIADLMDEVISDKNNPRTPVLKGILSNMFSLMGSINTVYVLDRVQQFLRVQELKGTIIKSAEVIQLKEEEGLREAEEIIDKFRRNKQADFSPGLRFDNFDQVLKYNERREREFVTGIKELDTMNIVPARQTLMLYLGEAKSGKSWMCVNLIKYNFLQGKKILYISNEMGEEPILQRCYQSIFSITKRPVDNVEVTRFMFEKDPYGREVLKGFETIGVVPEFSMGSRNARTELLTRIRAWGINAHKNLVIKRFPPRSLTLSMYRNYLDSLEDKDFCPDLVIIDYPAKMYIDPRNYRIEMGSLMDNLRAEAVARNHALFCPHQATRSGAKARTVTGTDLSEDWSIAGVADRILTFSRTRAEKQARLARLLVDRDREEGDGFGVLMSQNYSIGQYCLDSTLLPPEYFEKFYPGRREDDEGKSEADQ